MVSHHLEIERKYEMADVHAEPPALEWSFKDFVAAEPLAEHLDATYYDTAQSALSKHRIAVRRRTGGYDEGWHIKFDAAGGRHEVRFDVGKNGSEVPARVLDFVQVATLGAELSPRVALVTDRVRTVLSLPEVGAVAEVCEDSVRSTDYTTGIERRWCEWEVELLPPAETDKKLAAQVFAAVEKKLLSPGAVPSQSPAKIARALGKDAAFEQSRLATGSKKSPKKSAQGSRKKKRKPAEGIPDSAQLLTKVLETQVQALVEADLLVKAGVADATHLGRIAARQLRGTLRYMVRPYAKNAEVEKAVAELGRELRFYAGQMEQGRNGELLQERLGAKVPGAVVNSALLGTLSGLAVEYQSAGDQAAVSYVFSRRRLAVQEALMQLLDDVTMVADLPLNSENYMNKVAKRLRKGLLKALTTPVAQHDGQRFVEGDDYDENLHDVRKMAKVVRYVLTAGKDAGVPLTSEQRELMRIAQELQRSLGEFTDQLTFGQWLGTVQPAPDALGVGYLLGESATCTAYLRGEVFAQLPKVAKTLKKLRLP
ncbi:MAG: CYTH and CHAD domain-containing protein [Rothia sp. (in: high G+C Gram-positive bacteria)]|nr:CYTH and CHAD domain-containing protein [Rothia sp. (in: high G+C Gram-positive bacteria)]